MLIWPSRTILKAYRNGVQQIDIRKQPLPILLWQATLFCLVLLALSGRPIVRRTIYGQIGFLCDGSRWPDFLHEPFPLHVSDGLLRDDSSFKHVCVIQQSALGIIVSSYTSIEHLRLSWKYMCTAFVFRPCYFEPLSFIRGVLSLFYAEHWALIGRVVPLVQHVIATSVS